MGCEWQRTDLSVCVAACEWAQQWRLKQHIVLVARQRRPRPRRRHLPTGLHHRRARRRHPACPRLRRSDARRRGCDDWVLLDRSGGCACGALGPQRRRAGEERLRGGAVAAAAARPAVGHQLEASRVLGCCTDQGRTVRISPLASLCIWSVADGRMWVRLDLSVHGSALTPAALAASFAMPPLLDAATADDSGHTLRMVQMQVRSPCLRSAVMLTASRTDLEHKLRPHRTGTGSPPTLQHTRGRPPPAHPRRRPRHPCPCARRAPGSRRNAATGRHQVRECGWAQRRPVVGGGGRDGRRVPRRVTEGSAEAGAVYVRWL
jgi:hypothetical protein